MQTRREIYNAFARREMYNLRSNNLTLMLLKPNTNAMKRSFSYMAAIAWNCLPKDGKFILPSTTNYYFLFVFNLYWLISHRG